MRRIVGISLLLLMLSFSGTSNAHGAAVTSSDLQLSLTPGIFDLGGKPGSVSQTRVKIRNNTHVPQLVQATLQPYKPLGKVDQKSLDTIYSSHKWLQVEPSIFTLDPQQSKDILVTATIPRVAEPGGYYGSVDFTLLSKSSVDNGAHVYVNTRVSGLALMSVPGLQHHNLQVDKPYIQNSGNDLQLEVPISNTGSIHELTTTTVTVRDIFGGVVATWHPPPALILPAEHRSLLVPWQVYLPGWYKVEAAVRYGPQKTAQSQTAIIGIAPAWWMITSVICLIVIIILLWRTHGRWRRAWGILAGKS